MEIYVSIGMGVLGVVALVVGVWSLGRVLDRTPRR